MESTTTAKSSSHAPSAVLFLSDLSPNCKQSDIESMFQDFGDVLSVKLYKETLLNYCYVEMENVVEAFRAIDALQGQLYIDLPLSISWSTPFELTPLVAPVNQDSSSKVPMVQVLFSFICHQAQNPVTEDFIASIFNPFGLLVNVSIKRVNISQEKNSQNGYGFVHFCQTWYGVYSAVKCVQWFKKKTVDGVTLDAKFGEQFRRFLHRNQIVSKQDDNFVSPFGSVASLEFEYTALHGIHPQEKMSSSNQQSTSFNNTNTNNSTSHHEMSNLHSNMNAINNNNTNMNNVQLDMDGVLLPSSSASPSHLATSPRLHQHLSHSLSQSPSSQTHSPLLSLSHPSSPTTASATATSSAEALGLKKKMALQFYANQLQQLQLQQQQLQQQQYNNVHSGNSSVVSEDAASFGSNSMSMSSCSASATPQSPYLRMPSSTVAYLQQLHQNMLLQQQNAPSSASVGSNGSGSRQVGSPSMSRSSMGGIQSNNNSMLMTAANNSYDSNSSNISNNHTNNNSSNNVSFLQHLRQTPLSHQQPPQPLYAIPTSKSASHTGPSTAALDINSDASTIFSTPTHLGHNLSHQNSRHSISSYDRTLPLHATPSSSTSATHPLTQGSGKLFASYSSSGHSVVSVGSQGNNSVGSYGSVGQYSMFSGSQPSFSNNSHNHNNNNNNSNHSSNNSFHNNNNINSNSLSNNNMFASHQTNTNHNNNNTHNRIPTAARPTQGDYFSKVQQRQAEILELYRQQSQQQKQTSGDSQFT